MIKRLWPPAALAIVTLIGAGCSNASSESADDANATHGTKAARFAECMRDNGVSEFPDPDPSGSLTIDGVMNGSSLDPSGPAWKHAIGACKDLQPAGFTGRTRGVEEKENARPAIAR